MNDEKQLMTVSEAAQFLRLQPTTIRAWLLRRKLTYLKVGGRVFIRKSDLLDLLDESIVLAIAKENGSGQMRDLK